MKEDIRKKIFYIADDSKKHLKKIKKKWKLNWFKIIETLTFEGKKIYVLIPK